MTVPNRRRGAFLMISAALCWSLGGILVRNVSTRDAWEIVFWRSAFMVVFMLGVLVAWHGRRALQEIRATGLAGLMSGALFACMFFFFILSLIHTTVANTMALTSVSPFFVALFARLFLAERIAARTWLAISVALAGMALMFVDGVGGGGLSGDVLAICVPVAFALNVCLLRRMHARVDMVPAVLIAGIIAVLVALPLAWPLAPAARDLGVLAVMGFVQIGTGCVLMTRATRHLSASEIGLYALLENVTAPIWVWIGIGERPSDLALAGGLIVVGSLAVNQWFAPRAAPEST